MPRLLLLGFIWGWSFLFIKVGVEGMTPPTLACIRVALGAAVLHAWLRTSGLYPPADRRAARWAAAIGVIGSAVPFTLLAWGEERISSALTSVLNASTPLFTAVAAAAVVGERVRATQVVGLVLGLVGVAAAAGLGVADLSGSSLAGAGAAICAGACYGLAFALMRAHLTGIPPAVAAAGQLTAAAVVLAPFAVATSVTDGIELSWSRIGAVVTLGVVGTGIAYLLNYRIVADVGATRASLVTYVVPAVAVVVGVVVLDEPFDPGIVVGGALIAGGITLVNGFARLPRRPMAATGAVALVALAAATLPACGDGSSAESAGCEPAHREALDPASASHVLAGADAEYTTDPPTSGPHQPSPPLSGVLDEPLPRPAQVGALEAGGVLLQHRDLDADELAELESLAGEAVAVAPNPDLPAPVVATAWLFKQECSTLDVDALRQFVDDHLGKAPGTDA